MSERLINHGIGSASTRTRPMTPAEQRWHGVPDERVRLFGPTPYRTPLVWLRGADERLRSSASTEVVRGAHHPRGRERERRGRPQLER